MIKLAALALFLPSLVYAAPAGRDDFLSYGPGAAEEAMGGAVTSLVTGPTSLYYNSSRLGVGPNAVNAEWTRLMDGVSYSWLGASADTKYAALGLGIASLDMGNITARSSLLDPGTSVSSYQRAYMLGAAREIFSGFRTGSTLGLLDYNLAGFVAKGLFGDLGGSYRFNENLHFGVNLKNFFFPGLNFGNGAERYPKELRIAADYERYGLALAGQVNKALDGSSPKYLIGARYSMYKILTLRAGYDGYPSFGLGITTTDKRFAFDFSYKSRAFDASQRITLTYYFISSQDDLPKDAYAELEQRAKSLAEYQKQESNRLLETRSEGAAASLKKLLALEPGNSDAAMALSSLTGQSLPKIRLSRWALTPWERRKRKLYLRFSVAYGSDSQDEACATGQEFIKRWPGDERSLLISQLFEGYGCGAKANKEEQTK